MKVWSVAWKQGRMTAPAFWYLSSVRRAATVVGQLIRHGCVVVSAQRLRIHRRYRHVLNLPAVCGRTTMSDLGRECPKGKGR